MYDLRVISASNQYKSITIRSTALHRYPTVVVQIQSVKSLGHTLNFILTEITTKVAHIICPAESTYKTNLFVRVTVTTATVDGLEVLGKILLIFSLTDCGGDLDCIEIESRLRLCQPLLCKLPLKQCLRPHTKELR